MSKLEDVLATLDEEDAQAVREVLLQAQKDQARTARDLRLATDTSLKEAYPRAWRAYEKKRLDFGDVTDEAELKAMLKNKEEELAELGVPVSVDSNQSVAQAEQQQPAEQQPPEEDPAKVWGQPPQGANQGTVRDLTAEFIETMKADSGVDRDRLAEIVGEMNAKGAKQDIERLVDMLNAPPIVPRNVIF